MPRTLNVRGRIIDKNKRHITRWQKRRRAARLKRLLVQDASPKAELMRRQARKWRLEHPTKAEAARSVLKAAVGL